MCIILIVIFLSFLLWKIVAAERIFSPNKIESSKEQLEDNTVEGQVMNIEGHIKSSTEEEERNIAPGEAAMSVAQETSDQDSSMARAYRQEMSMQLILYSFSFLSTYVPFIVLSCILGINRNPSIFLWMLVQILYPLQGFFNIFIFLRPAARVTRIRRDGISWFKAYVLVAKNGGEAVVAENHQMLNHSNKPPTSVKYGVAAEIPPQGRVICSNECMHFDSSQELSRNNVAYNSSQDWYYVKGGSQNEIESDQNAKDAIAGIHHNDLDAIVEDDSFVGDSMDLSYQTK